jgi:mono/diheme cytochrome c family protein
MRCTPFLRPSSAPPTRGSVLFRRPWVGLVAGAVVLVGLSAPAPRMVGPATLAAQSQAGSDPARLSQMHYHFAQVSRIHEALVRGDLPAVRAPGMELSTIPVPRGVPATAMPFVVATRDAGRRAAGSKTLAEAADAEAMLLAQCGACHQASNIRIVPMPPERPNVGGLVGHMLDHQRAVDHLLLGLIVPSAAEWQLGMEGLQVAPLKREGLPYDARLTPEIEKAETLVHDLAGSPAAATPAERGAIYARLVTTCAQCHSLHSRLWGPTTSPAER